MVEEEKKDSKMSLLEHLIELRSRLIWAFLGFIVCFFIAFYSQVFSQKNNGFYFLGGV